MSRSCSPTCRWSLILLAVALSYLVAASALAASERIDFVWKDAQYRGPAKFRWSGMARNREKLRTLWDRFELRGPLPRIVFQNNVAVVAGSIGSSSCRLHLHDVRLNQERRLVTVRVYKEGVSCSDDVVRRTFTIAISRADFRPQRAADFRTRVRRIEDPNP